ncbi:glycosyltransferase [Propionivibrio soli]|uniref:glycosyltransferase n=1 Tax=Propionivibrio soli TaxID=2976531 RepID=UPI0021E85EF3|nr:glycosyltransferase [Propionivibrio soli]
MRDAKAHRRPIIAFAHHPWVEPEWMNRQQLLSRLGKRGWPVVYSYGALDWWERESARWRVSPMFNRIELRDGISDAIPGKIGARWQGSLWFDRSALRRHARFIRSAVAEPGERVIAMLFDPRFFSYIEHLEPCDVVFHAYDVYASQSGWTEDGSALQDALVKRAALITASSEGIARSLGAENVTVLPNGADIDAFSAGCASPEPDDLRGIPHPRIGYAGAINRKVDFRLITALARKRPDWHWVLIGRIERNEILADDYTAQHFAEAEGMANVHFVGQKDRRDVPAYVGHMDVNTMCYRSDDSGWWTACSPLKLHEYLACGLPVVSTPLEAVLPFSNVVNLASDSEQWERAVQTELDAAGAGSREGRQAVAQENSWDARVDFLENRLYALGA